MELRYYVHIIRKRAWIPLLLVLTVALGSLLQSSPIPAYSASMRFVVGLQPEPRTGDYYAYDRYYTWLTAEYLVDDLSEVVKSAAFAQAVREKAIETGTWEDPEASIPAGAIQGATSSGKLHRILTVSITWADASQLADLANATVTVLREQAASFFALTGSDRIEIHLIDPPSVGLVAPGLTQRLQVPIRVLLALIAGVALTFLLDYLDDAVRCREEIESLGIPVLGEIPAPHRLVSFSQRSRTP